MDILDDILGPANIDSSGALSPSSPGVQNSGDGPSEHKSSEDMQDEAAADSESMQIVAEPASSAAEADSFDENSDVNFASAEISPRSDDNGNSGSYAEPNSPSVEPHNSNDDDDRTDRKRSRSSSVKGKDERHGILTAIIMLVTYACNTYSCRVDDTKSSQSMRKQFNNMFDVTEMSYEEYVKRCDSLSLIL
jgi:hypothetical protein